VVFLFSVVNVAPAEGAKAEQANSAANIRQRQTLTNGFWGLNDRLEDKGIDVSFGLTNIYQQNVHGGLSAHRRAGRYTGSYDLEVAADLQKLLGFESGSLYIHGQGGWPDTAGIDPGSLGSAFGVNADAIGNRAMDIVEFFYQGPVFGDNLTLTVGKIDFTAVFDTSAYADDETTQFLNGAFVDNPTIPFPDYALGAVLTWDLTDWWYIMGGAADAQADGRETGFRTAFHKQDYFFYALETGVTANLNWRHGPLAGAYRVGLWNDPQPKANWDAGKNYRDDVGFYASCDQMLTRENNDPEDTQGLGAFLRYGYAPSKKNDITSFWSGGFQYQGLFEGRDDDVLGLGYAHGVFADTAASTYPEDYESALEAYYNAQVTPWCNISPSIQYITNPGGSSAVSDAVVFGIRAQIRF